MISERAKRQGMRELEIFDRFEIDRNLPKYKKNRGDRNVYSSDDATVPQMEGGDMRWNPDSNRNFVIGTNITGNVTSNDISNERLSIKQRIVKKLLSLLDKENRKRKEKEKSKIVYMPIVEFFTSLSSSYKDLTPIADVAEHYETALNKANGMGQMALVEQFKDLIEVVRGESHLISIGLKQFVTEEQVIDFYEKVGEDKNLQLTWIKNFSRVIPDEVYNAKMKADEREIFDNYVVLHYDPMKKGKELTKEEKEKKKDPILFGVIKNSRKLYYIADWKDEYCDLTLEDMFTTLNKKVSTISYKSVKTFIDKVETKKEKKE